MRIRGGPTLLQPGLVVFCTLVSIFILNSASYYLNESIPWYLAMALSFIVALLISSGIGMLFEERSRLGGTLLLAVFLPGLYFFLQFSMARFDGFLPGLIMGLGLFLHSIVNNRFDTVAKIVRIFVKFYFLLMAAILIYTFALLVIQEETNENPAYINTGFNSIFMVLLSICFLIILFGVLMKYIRGIKASDVFIYGPSGSGKTLLVLGFYDQFVRNFSGMKKEVIISSSIDNEEYYRIENMMAEFEAGIPPKSNTMTDLALYIFNGKKSIKPIEFTIIDYGGEYTERLTTAEFKKALSELNSTLKENPGILREKIDDPVFLNELKDKYAGELVYNVQNLVLAYIYKKFQDAGKIIFLVDGDHVANYHEDGAQELTRLFGQYSRIMDLLGKGKSYAIVITKADKIKDISDIIDNSPEAKEFEKEIFDMLTQIVTFKEIQNRAKKEPIHFFIVSVLMKNSEGKEVQKRQIFPWRIDEVANFGS